MKLTGVALNTDILGGSFDKQPFVELPLSWTYYSDSKPEDTLSRVKDAEIIVTFRAPLPRAVIEKCPKLKLICAGSTGYDYIDLQAAKEKGICVCNVPHYSTFAVVQLTILLILALTTNFIHYVEAIEKGEWYKSSLPSLTSYPIHELQDKVLGIIGYGNIGKEVAKLAQSFKMKILLAQVLKRHEPPEYIPLQTLLPQVDILSIHVPLTVDTRNLISKNELKLMKPSALLINTSRGEIVNEMDLADALKKGIIAGAGIDVLSKEPPSKDNPLLQKDVPNLIITPHIGAYSEEAEERLILAVADNIRSFLNKIPKNVIA